MTIAELILSTEPIDTPVLGVDADPTVGSGAMLDEMSAPEDFDSSTIAFDPWI